jgi:hypothetical protein
VAPLLYAAMLIIDSVFAIGEYWQNQYYICKNITDFEYKNIYSIPYLWESMSRKFFNPFNKGVLKNIIEAIIPLFGCKQSKIDVELNNTSDLESQSRPHFVYTGKELTNWRVFKIYTLSDIENSPRKKVYEEVQRKKQEKKNKKLQKKNQEAKIS